MAAKTEQQAIADYWTAKCRELLQVRNNLTRDELEYLMEKVATMKDERLKSCIAGLVGWGDDERAELETFCAISLELMRKVSPSRLREAARMVELRSLTKSLRNE